MSTSLDSLLALIAVWGGAMLGFVVGMIYFARSRSDAALSIRIVSSAFGPSLSVLFVVASFWWPEKYRYKPIGVQTFYCLQVIPLFLCAFAVTKYPGNRRLHWFLVPAGLLAWAWTFAWGWLFIHGE